MKRLIKNQGRLERITRLELATSTLARWRSTRWAKSACECLNVAIKSYLTETSQHRVVFAGFAKRNRIAIRAIRAQTMPAMRICQAAQQRRQIPLRWPNYLAKRGNSVDWRSEWDSNPRPPPWQGGVLTNWTTGPNSLLFRLTPDISDICLGSNGRNSANADGGSYRARTYDPLLVRQMLSQLS